MGGQNGGMRDEAGNFPEICKKGFQAQITDISIADSDKYFQTKKY